MTKEMEDVNFTNIESFKMQLEKYGFDVEYRNQLSSGYQSKQVEPEIPSSDLKKITL